LFSSRLLHPRHIVHQSGRQPLAILTANSRFRAMGLIHACSASRVAAAEVSRNVRDWQARMY